MPMTRYSDYYFFRFFVLPAAQISFNFEDDQSELKPKDRIKRAIDVLEEKRKITEVFKNRKYLLYFSKRITPTTIICKLAREVSTIRYTEGETDIQRVNESDFPFIYLIMETERQIILFQKKVNVFRTVEEPKKVLASFLAVAANLYNYEIKIDEITCEHYFWEYVEKSEAIFELKLDMKSPNLFGFDSQARDFLKNIKEIVNNTELSMDFRNDAGRLTISKKSSIIPNFIKYISAGGGHWKMKILSREDSEKRTISSKESVKKVRLFSDIEQEQPSRILESIKNADDLITDHDSNK